MSPCVLPPAAAPAARLRPLRCGGVRARRCSALSLGSSGSPYGTPAAVRRLQDPQAALHLVSRLVAAEANADVAWVERRLSYILRLLACEEGMQVSPLLHCRVSTLSALCRLDSAVLSRRLVALREKLPSCVDAGRFVASAPHLLLPRNVPADLGADFAALKRLVGHAAQAGELETLVALCPRLVLDVPAVAEALDVLAQLSHEPAVAARMLLDAPERALEATQRPLRRTDANDEYYV